MKVVRNICKFDSYDNLYSRKQYHSASPVALSMGDGNFRPPQNPHPLTDHQKIDAGDYVGGPYGYAKFGANPPIGASGQMGEISPNIFYLYLFLGTHLQVRPVDGFSHLMAQTTGTRARVCLFGVSLILLLILEVKSPPKKTILGA